MGSYLRLWTESPELGDIVDVEASHLALAKTEDVSDRLVLQAVRLPLKRFALEIADGLPDLCDDRAVLSSTKAERIDVRTDKAPVGPPLRGSALAPRGGPAAHPVARGNIIRERGNH